MKKLSLILTFAVILSILFSFAAFADEVPAEATTPETEPVAPETEPVVPETEPIPETEPVVPETEPTPETEPQAPETEPPAPETEPPAPETEPSVPETEPPAPETEPTPETESPAPETEPTVPETEPTPETGDEMTKGELEELIRDTINAVLDKGDENLAGNSWWDVLATWVREHLGEIAAAIGGVFALIGFCVLNPKVRSYVNVLGTACKNWFGEISLRTEKLLMKFTKIDAVIAALQRRVDVLIESNMLLVTVLEDVIKLSGASEGKKEIYIKNIEAAKETVKKVNETKEVKTGESDEV